MEREWQGIVHAVELLCRRHGVASGLAKRRIFDFLDPFPRAVAVGSLDGTACVFTISPCAGKLIPAAEPIWLEHPSGCAVHSVLVGTIAGKRFITTGCADGYVRLFSATSGALLGSFQAYATEPVYSVQLQCGGCAGGGADDVEELWCATATGGGVAIVGPESQASRDFAHIWCLGMSAVHEARCVASCAHRFGVNGVSLDAGMGLLATASDDRTAGLWDLSGQQLATCAPHGSFVWEVALAAELGLVATACEDRAARLFDLSGQCLACFPCDAGCCEVAIDAAAQALVATSADGTLRAWSLGSSAGEVQVLAVVHHGCEVHGAASVLRHGRVLTSTLHGELVEWALDARGPAPWHGREVVRRCLFDRAAVSVAVG